MSNLGFYGKSGGGNNSAPRAKLDETKTHDAIVQDIWRQD